ncbi:Hypoxanthine phosphoribosyltransferase [Candidatus Magnetaquicoccaceae bacterium FCR-1]|uniref:Hypoxanthine phosphoribosyltransferase n=1 Tax=Candidatus Magnetaquiglobus chichijimensis TaxID=3141448 RepID=A0ABQ0C4X4_9PROT
MKALDHMTVMLDAEQIQQAVADMAERINREVIASAATDREPVMVVVLKGAFLFASDLLRHLSRPIPVVFAHTRSQEERIVMTVEDQEFLRGRDLILVDILLDSGDSLKRLHRWLTDACQPASIRIAVLLHKTVLDPEPLPLDFLGYEVPDLRLVGYGMDEHQRFRGLPCVYTWWKPTPDLA